MQTFSLERLDTATGRMLLVTDDQRRLRALDWQDHEERMQRLLERHYGADAVHLSDASTTSQAARALEAYFAGDFGAIANVPTATNGTPFQRRVWAALRLIPVGETLSYGALAARIGQPRAARAVGLANGCNPIAIVVPCHRVIGANTTLTGYGGGVDRKRWLLAHESRELRFAAALSEPVCPTATVGARLPNGNGLTSGPPRPACTPRGLRPLP
jgi:methylated-DNA-[protein]-cysteine S-methyltransferase